MSEYVALEIGLDRIMEGNEITRGTRKFFVSVGGICGGALIRYVCKVASNVGFYYLHPVFANTQKIINYFGISAVKTC